MANDILTPPNPDPIPPDDDDDDGEQYWPDSGASTPVDPLITYALGNHDPTTPPDPGARCYSALFSSEQAWSAPFARALPASPSGSAPASLGRQMARRYRSTGGGGAFDTFMLTTETETRNPGPWTGGNKYDTQLFFAWLRGDQYEGLRTETNGDYIAHGAITFNDLTSMHDVLTFAAPPTFLVTGGGTHVQAQGVLQLRDTVTAGGALVSLNWQSVKATVFGIVGHRTYNDGSSSATVPAAWSWSSEPRPAGPNLMAFDVGPGFEVNNSPNIETFAVGWGLYDVTMNGETKTFAAVTPPVVVNGRCTIPGVTNGGGTLRDGTFPGTGPQAVAFDRYRTVDVERHVRFAGGPSKDQGPEQASY